MHSATLVGNQGVRSFPRSPGRAAWRPFLLGVTISALMWAALGAVTTLSAHGPVARLLGVALAG